MVANTSKRRLSSTTKMMKKPLAASNFKAKIIVKENDRIARMKAARETYSKLSKERIFKPGEPALKAAPKRVAHENNVEQKENVQRCHDSSYTPGPDFEFKPMQGSLDMIRDGRIRIHAIGRFSSIAGGRSLRPRPSLLPLGINVFDSNVSVNDQQKVREFISARCNTSVTPCKAAGSFNKTAEHNSVRSLRSVRFCMEAAIEEQRESGGDDILQGEEYAVHKQEAFGYGSTSKNSSVPAFILKERNIKTLINQEPSTSISASYERNVKMSQELPTSISASDVKKTTGSYNKKASPEPRRSLFPGGFKSTRFESSLDSTANDSQKSKTNFVHAFTLLFNMNDEEWKEVEPIMIDQLSDLLQETRQRIRKQVTTMSTMNADSSELLPPLPDRVQSSEPRKAGFCKINRRRLRNSNTELQANQEVMLINETANRTSRRSSRLRQKDPVSRMLGGDSPFVPIQGSPLY